MRIKLDCIRPGAGMRVKCRSHRSPRPVDVADGDHIRSGVRGRRDIAGRPHDADMAMLSRRRFVNRNNQLAGPCRGDGCVENGIVCAGSESAPAGVRCRRSVVVPDAGQPVRLCIGEQLLAVERWPQ